MFQYNSFHLPVDDSSVSIQKHNGIPLNPLQRIYSRYMIADKTQAVIPKYIQEEEEHIEMWSLCQTRLLKRLVFFHGIYFLALFQSSDPGSNYAAVQ